MFSLLTLKNENAFTVYPSIPTTINFIWVPISRFERLLITVLSNWSLEYLRCLYSFQLQEMPFIGEHYCYLTLLNWLLCNFNMISSDFLAFKLRQLTNLVLMESYIHSWNIKYLDFQNIIDGI